jgi:hypothetical protein
VALIEGRLSSKGFRIETRKPVFDDQGGQIAEFDKDNGDLQVERVASGTLLWRNPVVGMPHTIIRVLTEAEVPRFAAQAHESASALLRLASEEIRSLIQDADGPVRSDPRVAMAPPGRALCPR